MFTDNVFVYDIDPSTGRLRFPAAADHVAVRYGPNAMAVDPTGRFAYVTNFASWDISMYAIHPTTGGLTSLGPPVAAGAAPYAITVDDTGRFAYVTNDHSDNVSMFHIDGATGYLT